MHADNSPASKGPQEEVKMEKRKSTLAVVAAAVVLASLAMAVLAPVSVRAEAVKPTALNGNQVFDNPSFIGMQSTRTTEGSGASSFLALAASAGDFLVYAICPRGGTLGAYSVMFDSDIATGLDVHTRSNIWGKAFSVGAPGTESGVAQANLGGCFIPPWPKLFTNGGVIAQSSTAHYTEVFYRLADGRNP